MQSFDDIVVRKPWGHEYLCYRNEILAIWLLHIREGQRTSLHCHPNKHTGLVVLDGAVKIRFLRGEVQLQGLDKIHIFRARFHSTEALSPKGAYLLEIETPEDKLDLVRLEDSYGRAGQNYEGSQHYTIKTNEALKILEPGVNQASEPTIHGCQITHIGVHHSQELTGYGGEVVVVIVRGGLWITKGNQILYPGDVVDGWSLGRLAPTFQVVPGTTILVIRRIET